MITIPQHGKSGELFDINTFLADIDSFFRVDAWRVKVEECLGEGAIDIERKSAGSIVFSDTEFRTAYKPIYQTIDGSFVAFYQGIELCQLTAIDSTDWDISSSSEFEAYMMKKYGR